MLSYGSVNIAIIYDYFQIFPSTSHFDLKQGTFEKLKSKLNLIVPSYTFQIFCHFKLSFFMQEMTTLWDKILLKKRQQFSKLAITNR